MIQTTQAQERSYNFDSYGVDRGLTQSSIYSLIQDEEGFLWISTFDGVNRFDGYVFNEYRYNPAVQKSPLRPEERVVYNSASQQGRAVVKSFGLSGTRHHSFYRDARNQLLIAHNLGISLYDRYKNTFRNVFVDSDGPTVHAFGLQDLIIVVDGDEILIASSAGDLTRMVAASSR